MIVLNSEPFIHYQLASIYPYAHEIIIVEGAVEKFSHAATPDGHSTDRTLEVIANFPDPAKKITLITRNGFWREKDEMFNESVPAVTGDIIWHVDVDEFYLPWVHEYIAKLFEEDKTLDQVSFRLREFFASLEYEVVGGVAAAGLRDVRRVHRFQQGDRWLTHRPPTLTDASGKPKRVRKEISAEELFNKGICLFHPATLFEKQTFDKFKYYRQMWKGIEQTDEWLYDTWYKFKNPLRLHGTTTYASWIEHYDGPYPPLLEQMVTDVREGKYPDITLRDNSDIERYLQSPRYHEDVMMGQALNDLLVNFRERKILPALRKLLFIVSHYFRSPWRVTYRFCMTRILSFLWQKMFIYSATMAKRLIRMVLPDKVYRKLYYLLVSRRTHFDISFELISEWPNHEEGLSWVASSVTKRYKDELKSFKLENAIQSSITQDNLEVLSKIDLEKPALLDFGCGNGIYRTILANYPHTKDWLYVGAEANPALVNICRDRYPDTRFEVINNPKLPFQDKEFDVILASGVVQYVEDYGNLLEEFRHITKEYVAITRLPVWECHQSSIVLQKVQHKWGKECYPLHVFNRSELEAEFMRLGFTLMLRDQGSEIFHVSGVSEPLVHNTYLLGVK